MAVLKEEFGDFSLNVFRKARFTATLIHKMAWFIKAIKEVFHLTRQLSFKKKFKLVKFCPAQFSLLRSHFE
jgi:hypothetical protein